MFASHTVVIASGSGETFSERASASITGVSSTAVVSRFSEIVVIAANATHKPNNAAKFPRPSVASRVASMSKNPASAVSSASTRTVARNSRIGRIRRTVASASAVLSSPVPTQNPPEASRQIAIQSRTLRRRFLLPPAASAWSSWVNVSGALRKHTVIVSYHGYAVCRETLRNQPVAEGY